MNTRSVKVPRRPLLLAGIALLATSVAQAQGHRDRVVEREAQRQQQEQSSEAPAPQQQRRSAPEQQRRSAPVQAQSPGPGHRDRVVEREARRDAERREYYGGRQGGYYGTSPGYRPGTPRFRNPNYGRVVTRLPPGYRDYYWRGRPYYYAGGHWYNRRGASYVVVGAPFGLFVSYLPSYYSTVWVGGSRYYYVDDTYYSYDPLRRGYIVTRSPYGDDAGYDEDYGDDESVQDELYIYPTRGQSEQQQADDKYECHKWSFEQTGFDPTQMQHESSKREQYDRALTACLTARGYSVK